MKKLFPMRKSAASKEGLLQLANVLSGTDLIALQIGSYAGDSTELFLSTGKFAKIYCIDPWENGYDQKDAASFTNDLAEEIFDKRFRKESRVIKIRGYSFDEVPKFPDAYFDFVYIDGCHKREAVYKDLQLVFPKLKSTGLLAGHDYGPWCDVIGAVDDFLQGAPKQLFKDSSWCCKKEVIKR